MPMSRNAEKLSEIARLTPAPRRGPGLDAQQMVPAFKIVNRTLAKELQQQLLQAAIGVRTKTGRSGTEFFVSGAQLGAALRHRDAFTALKPDTHRRSMSRDFDSVFLLAPLTALAVFVSRVIPFAPRFAWVAVLVTGFALMLVSEWLLRRYRLRYIGDWGIAELLCVTAIVAVTIAVWRLVL